MTTSPESARAFYEGCGKRAIFKSASSVRSIVVRMTDEHLERLPLIRECPAQFQEWVPGTDIRVHVIGERVFATEITTDATDYRYSGRTGHDRTMRGIELPQEIEERCRRVAADLGLVTAGVDLRLTPTGEWYCFEANPTPGFTFYQQYSGQRIGDALVDLLIRGRPDDTILPGVPAVPESFVPRELRPTPLGAVAADLPPALAPDAATEEIRKVADGVLSGNLRQQIADGGSGTPDSAVYVPSADVTAAALDSDTVLLNLRTRVYFSLNRERRARNPDRRGERPRQNDRVPGARASRLPLPLGRSPAPARNRGWPRTAAVPLARQGHGADRRLLSGIGSRSRERAGQATLSHG